MDDALLGAVQTKEGNAEFLAVGFKLVHLTARLCIRKKHSTLWLSHRRQPRGNAMVDRGSGFIWSPHLDATIAQAGEGLG